MNTKGSNHLTLIERQKIREMLDENESCKSIAIVLKKDERTFSRETKKRRDKQENRRYGLYEKKTIPNAKDWGDSHSSVTAAKKESIAVSSTNSSMIRV